MALGVQFCPPNCADRCAGCQSTCERYKEKMQEYEKRKAALVEYRKKHSPRPNWTVATGKDARVRYEKRKRK